MGIIVKAGSSEPKELIPAGNYVARCYRMIHIGTSWDDMWDKAINRVRVTWELPTETRVFNEDKGPQPFVIDKEYTLSLHEKANLRKDLESWRGKSFTEAELEQFDITKLVGAYCMLNIIHNTTKKGVEYAMVSTIASIPKGIPKPEAVNEDLIWDFENNFDTNVLKSFPDFIKDRILGSNEYEDCMNALEGAEFEKQMEASEPADKDDLPF